MASLADIVQQVMEGYAVEGLNGHSYLTRSVDGQLLTMVFIGNVRGRTVIDTGLVVRLLGEKVIIEHDTNSKPLVDALAQAGVPRARIVLVYAGEHVEETA